MNSKRKLDIEEIKAMIEDLADRVSVEGKEIYDEVKARIDYIYEHADEHIEDKIEELKPKIEALRAKIAAGSADIIDVIEERIDDFQAMIQAEYEEYQELGASGWAKASHRGLIIGGIIVVAIIIVIAGMLGVTPSA